VLSGEVYSSDCNIITVTAGRQLRTISKYILSGQYIVAILHVHVCVCHRQTIYMCKDPLVCVPGAPLVLLLLFSVSIVYSVDSSYYSVLAS